MDAKRILIVDNEQWASHLLKENLERAGHYVVAEVNEAGKAVDAAKEFHPDLILLDAVMPDTNGTTVADSLYAEPLLRDVPILFQDILSTSSANHSSEEDHPCVSKSASLHEFVRCVEKQLAKADANSHSEPLFSIPPRP